MLVGLAVVVVGGFAGWLMRRDILALRADQEARLEKLEELRGWMNKLDLQNIEIKNKSVYRGKLK